MNEVQVILGNDLAGQLALSNLIMYDKPASSDDNVNVFKHVTVVEENVKSVNVLTRARAKQTVNETNNVVAKPNISCKTSDLIKLREDVTLTNAL